MRRLLLAMALAACDEVGPPAFTEAQLLGGEQVSAQVLNRGRDAYNTYCRGCHGPFGDGKGPLGLHQEPPARDLRLGIMKFAAVPAGSLPRDQDMARVVRRGLPGTAMLPWQVPNDELGAVVQYVKTFSPRWRTEKAGEPVSHGPDPWIGRAGEAAARGAELYHGSARCVSCHPAYEPAARIGELARAAGVDPSEWLRPEPQAPLVGKSDYGPLAATDLRRSTLRGGSELADLYRAIAAGVGGTAMPTWKGALAEADLWALAYYVRELNSRGSR